MNVKDVFEIYRVPDTVINKTDSELAIDADCQRIRRKLLDQVSTLEPYAEMIYVRYGRTIPHQTPVFAVMIQDAFVLISEDVLEGDFDRTVANAGVSLHCQLHRRAPAVA